MEVNTVLKIVTIALSLALDAAFVLGGAYMAYKFNLMRKSMLEADRAYAKAFPELSELHQTNKLTLSLLWFLIISCALGSLAYLLTVSKLYAFLFRG